MSVYTNTQTNTHTPHAHTHAHTHSRTHMLCHHVRCDPRGVAHRRRRGTLFNQVWRRDVRRKWVIRCDAESTPRQLRDELQTSSDKSLVCRNSGGHSDMWDTGVSHQSLLVHPILLPFWILSTGEILTSLTPEWRPWPAWRWVQQNDRRSISITVACHFNKGSQSYKPCTKTVQACRGDGHFESTW